MQRQITRGASANSGLIFHIFAQDSTSTTGAGKASVAYSSWSCRYIRNGEAISGAITPEDITTIGTYQAPTASTNIRIKAVDNTNMIGVYEVHIHSAWVNTTNTCQSLTIYLTASGVATLPIQIPLSADDTQTAKPTNFSSLSIDGSGRVDVIKINGTSQTARDIGASVLLSSGTGTGQLDFTSGVVKANAVQLLGTAWLTPAVAGTPDVNAKQFGGAPVTATTSVTIPAASTLATTTGAVGSVTGAVGSISGVTFPTNFGATSITAGGIVKADVDTIKTQTVTCAAGVTVLASVGTAATSTAQTGDCFARLGAPAGASVSADVAAVKSDTGAIKTKTDFLPSATAGAAGGVFIAGTNAATTVTTSFTTTFTGNLTGSVGSVTGAVGSVTGAVGSVTGNVGGNVTGSVGSVATGGITSGSFAAGAIDATAMNVNGSEFTAIPWNASWDAEVQSEVQDAIEVNHLDHLLAVDYDPAAKPGVATALLNELIESDAGVSRYTANALEQAPTGGSAPTAAQIADAVWDEAQADHVAAGSFGITASEIADILVDTAEIGVAGAGLTNINLPDQTMNITGNITGNLSGSVGSVTGAVGSVTGNVGGNVTGSVGSVATGGITSGSFSAGAIDAAAMNVTGSEFTAIPWNAAWDAEVQSEVEDALVVHRLDELLNADSDIDGVAPPTVGSVFHELMTKTAGSFTYDQTTDSLEALRDRGDAAWTTATGFSTHSAADVWSVGTRLLTAGTNIVLAKGVGVTGFNDIAATDIVSAGAITTLSGAVVNVDTVDTLTTYTGNTPQTGDTYALANGANGFVAIKADTAAILVDTGTTLDGKIDVIDGIVDSILVDTAEIGVAGAGLTNINLPDQTMNITGNITGNLSGSVGSVTGNVGGNVTGTIGGLTAAALADFFDTNSGTTYGAAVAGSVVKEIVDNSGGTPPTAAAIADAVWDEAQSGHVAAGSFGEIATEIADIKTKTDFLPSATAGAAGGVFIAGTNAPVTITGSGNALTLTSTGSNGHGLIVTGNGTGDGLRALSGTGATGDGICSVSQATNGNGINIGGAGTGDGVKSLGGATGRGIAGIGGATSGDGIVGTSTLLGHGIRGIGVGSGKSGLIGNGGTNASGIVGVGNGTKHGMDLFAGASGSSLRLSDSAGTGDGALTLSSATLSANLTVTGTTTLTGAVTASSASNNINLGTDAITSTVLATSAVTEIQTGLSTLTAADIRTAVGLASANLDTQLSAIDDYIDTEVAAIKTKTDFLPSAAAGSTGGLLIAGSNAATTFDSATVTGALTVSDGIIVTVSTVDRSAVTLTGNGTGDGFKATGGATAHGMRLTGGGASKHGLLATGGNNASGFSLVGTGSGNGILMTAGASGKGFRTDTFNVTGATDLTGVVTASNAGNNIAGVTATLGADSITSTVLAASAVTEIQSGLATSASISALNNLSAAQVNAEVLDVLNVDTFAEIGQEAPAATTTIRKMIAFLYKMWRNKKTQTATEFKLYNDDLSLNGGLGQVDQKSTVADDGTTTTIGEIGTGP